MMLLIATYRDFNASLEPPQLSSSPSRGRGRLEPTRSLG